MFFIIFIYERWYSAYKQALSTDVYTRAKQLRVDFLFTAWKENGKRYRKFPFINFHLPFTVFRPYREKEIHLKGSITANYLKGTNFDEN